MDLLAPRRCVGCDLELSGLERAFCGGCEPLVEPVLDGFRPPALSSAAYVCGGPLADGIRRLKYEGRTDLATPLGHRLAIAALPFAGLVDVVMAVPLHRARLRSRGFNQSALLAAPVARALGVPLDVWRLSRVRDTPPQVGLDAAQRAENIRGAFRCRPDVEARVLLVDDVRTTGATFAAAAEVVRKAGATTVFLLALGLAEGPSVSSW